MTRITIIGGGKVGNVLVGGLIDGGISPFSIYVVGRTKESLAGLKETYGIVDTDDPVGAAGGADAVFLCVKPCLIIDMLEQIANVLDDSEVDMIMVSMVAGTTLDKMESVCTVGAPVTHVVPSTSMLVDKGVCAVAPSRFVTESQTGEVVELLERVGSVEVVDESLMSAVTAVSGSGPAYFFQSVEAMTDAGVNLGLKRNQAKRLASATAAGAAETVTREDTDPTVLRADVTSPGGTTAAATRVFEEEGVRCAMHRALQAYYDKASEMGR